MSKQYKMHKTATLQPNPNNPRTIRKEKLDKLVDSLREFPEMLEARPIVCDPNMVVLGGNMRLKAAQLAGLEEVPVYVATWDEAQSNAFIIKDNVSFGEWDWDQLANEWDEADLTSWGLDVPTESFKEPYTAKVESPVYEPTQETAPEPRSLYTRTRYDKLMDDIAAADVPEDIRQFLELAATRHIEFRYADVAEYYAHATPEVQQLMEDSALVIIDFKSAIQNGFVSLADELVQSYLDEHA